MKRLLLLFIIFSFSLFTLKAQGSWSPRASLPDSTRGYGIGFSIGNYGYIGLGVAQGVSGYQYYNDFWQFSPGTNSWKRMADFPGKAVVSPATFVIGNNAYVVCGSRTVYLDSDLTECWVYSSISNTWIQKHNFPGLSRSCAVGFAIGNKGYIATGYDTLPSLTPFLNDVWEYDTSDTWTQKNNFGGSHRYAACGFAVGGKAYICFGDTEQDQDPVNDIWAYDTANDSWIEKTSCPDSIGFASGFVIGNNIYVGAGQNDAYPGLNPFWMYISTDDTWRKQANFPEGEQLGCSAFSIADTGYMGLGDSTWNGSNTFFRFIPDSTTGIDEVQAEGEQVNIYPNPFSVNCTILIKSMGNYSPQALKVSDIEGNTMNVTINKTGNNYSINRGNLPAGIYILSIELNNQIIHKKLIIIN